MKTNGETTFSALTTEGGLLPREFLARVVADDPDLPGLGRGDYHLRGHQQLAEEINGSWNVLVGAWRSLRSSLAQCPEDDPAMKLTRKRWLLPLFRELGYDPLGPASPAADGKRLPVSHAWHRSPVHLVGYRMSLDRRHPGVRGAAVGSPHGLVQEYLNRSGGPRWGFVSNGRVLRLLRDHRSLARQAFVELDLEAIMEGEQFSDFRLLWLLCHHSRVEAEPPHECWLERWFQRSQNEGVRAREKLRRGVRAAVTVLGTGFLKHCRNKPLQQKLAEGELKVEEYYQQLLRLVYRLIFLFVAEDRGLLLDPRASEEARERYLKLYATRGLRRAALAGAGGSHGDRWQGLRAMMEKLDGGSPELALPALGSFLWSRAATSWLIESDIANEDFLGAVRCLCTTTVDRQLHAVNWGSIGPEELGSVYESLLELCPRIDGETATFELITSAGNERKSTGSYYTPRALVERLLDSALDPVLEEAAGGPAPEAAILRLKVCDPACGSGHFLLAAARRIARRLAAVRSGEAEPSPEALQTAVRDVVGWCLYGVDVNPMAVELCKVSLWMEAIEPGKPLSYLEHRIQVGNSLLGATPAAIEQGIPDAAFSPLPGDDRELCRTFRDSNNRQRKHRRQYEMWPQVPGTPLRDKVAEIDATDDSTNEGIKKKNELFLDLKKQDIYVNAHLLPNIWCSAFIWEKWEGWARDGKSRTRLPITDRTLRKPEGHYLHLDRADRDEARRYAGEYQFFHWYNAFPSVFRVPRAEQGEEPDNPHTGWSGGFDVVLVNPPWERIKLQEKEFFSWRSPAIAGAPHAAARKQRIAELEETDPKLWSEWQQARRRAEGTGQLVRGSGLYPLCGRGDVNTYALFAELNRHLVAPGGRVGCIVPAGIVTDHTTRHFFRDLMETGTLVSLHGFREIRQVFPGTDSRDAFALMTIAGRRGSVPSADLVFDARELGELDQPDRHVRLRADELKRFNPNTGTCPVFRTRRDAAIAAGIYERVPILLDDGPPERNPWRISFQSMFHMANDSHRFRTREELEKCGWVLQGNVFTRGELRYLPLWEAKMVHHFDHRFGDYRDRPASSRSTALPAPALERLQDPGYAVLPRYWLPEADVEARLEGRWDGGWLLGWRDISRAADARTVIAGVVPRTACADTLLLAFPQAEGRVLLAGCLSSFVVDYAARQKVRGVHLKYHVLKQLPILPPQAFRGPAPWAPEQPLSHWLSRRIVELVYTTWDLRPFARDCGWHGPPFSWDPERRLRLRCELDAAFFHLYGIVRDDVEHIFETFPIVKRRDRALHGDYRSKLLIVELYDRMQRAVAGGESYLSPGIEDQGR